MKRFIIELIAWLGNAIGALSRLWPCKLSYWIYLLQRYIVTARHRNRFKSFGRSSVLASDVTLLSPEYISIGKNVSVMRHCVLETCPDAGLSPHLQIGDHCSIGEYTHITSARQVIIGEGLLTGRFVLITDNGHGKSSIDEATVPPIVRSVHSNGSVIIGRNVWIGDKVTILPNIKIGDGAVIAANAVVTKDVPAYSVAAGCPAKVVKTMK